MPYDPIANRIYNGIFLGEIVRKSIAKTTTYRNRSGNGYYGSVLGKRYQSKYPYVVPLSINNPESQPVRVKFIRAMYHWKNILTHTQKAEYTARAKKKKAMSGHNLYIREFIKGLI